MNKLAEKLKKIADSKEEQHQSVIFGIPAEVRESRITQCNECEHLYKLTSTCKKCGCFMKVKTYLPNAVCPIGKWGKYDKPNSEQA